MEGGHACPAGLGRSLAGQVLRVTRADGPRAGDRRTDDQQARDLFANDLLAEGEPEAEFHPGVAARMPRKRVGAGAVVRDGEGRVLLVEPRYKPHWDLPGGVVEAGESPLDGCRRELAEELGLDLPVTRLLVVDWVPQQGVWHDALLFVFDGGVLTPEQAAAVRVPPDELHAARFVPLAEGAAHLRPSTVRRLVSALAVLATGSPAPVHLQFGRPVR